MTEQTQQVAVSLGEHSEDLADALHRLEREDIVRRIWARDHTVWKDDPLEIVDRLGWLDVHQEMQEEAAELASFAAEVRQAGFRHVVLLGMGGSSLGPEVIRQTMGGAEGHPALLVLDSTVPAWVAAVSAEAKPATTLYLVSSKSGGTIEPRSLYKYFRRSVERNVAAARAGAHFVAITDEETSLQRLAEEGHFRRTFLNRPDIGGRYSVLSYFGLVPAALTGVDLGRLLTSASTMAERCGPQVSPRNNPGAWLGAYIAAMALIGRDKLTLFSSASISGLELWIEQLIAESTGKDGKGIIPIAGEPVMEADAYGDDRTFVYLRREGDDNARTDVAIERLAASGHPVVRLDLRDAHELGGEFFRWEFATAVAGAVLGVHPFDQPNVQSAKDATSRILDQYTRSGALPRPGPSKDLRSLLEEAKPGDYLALMMYAQPTQGVERIVSELRRKVTERYRIATTAGYGPRFLHSTGQLHKGGPNSGLYAQFVTTMDKDIPIPGESYSLGTLVSAQALGDYQALLGAGRRAARVELERDAESGVLRLLASF